MRTILIKDLEFEELPEDTSQFYKLQHTPNVCPLSAFEGSTGYQANVRTETIEFNAFYDKYNQLVRIGLTEKVEKILGLGFNNIKVLHTRINNRDKIIEDTKRELIRANKAQAGLSKELKKAWEELAELKDSIKPDTEKPKKEYKNFYAM